MVEVDLSAIAAVPTTPMTARSKTGVTVLGTAIVVGVLGNLWLRTTPWGINLLLWTGALMLATLGIIRFRAVPTRGEGRWMWIPVVLFAGLVAWRSSDALIGLDLVALIVALALMAFRTTQGYVLLAGLAEYIWSLVMAGTHAMLGPALLAARDIEWDRLPRGTWTPVLLAAGRGLLFAAPVILVFGGLLMAADAVFADLVTTFFHIDTGTLFTHTLLTIFWAWLAAGFLNATLLGDDHTLPVVTRPGAARLGLIEASMVLGTLNVLFLTFGLVQFRYLFGGAVFPGLSYAEYARRGFFELVTVAALMLPLLLGIHWLLGNRLEGRALRLFQGLAGGLVVLLFVMIASALQRMRLYTDAFGLTELRLYTMAFMLWLGVLFGWFGVTVLRG